MATSLQQDLRQLRKLRVQYEKDSDRKKKSEAAFKKKQHAVYERMEAEGMGSIVDKTTKIQFVPTETIYADIQDRSEFLKWAREQDDLLIVEKENGELMNELVREKLDNGEAMPPGVGIRVRQYISQRAA